MSDITLGRRGALAGGVASVLIRTPDLGSKREPALEKATLHHSEQSEVRQDTVPGPFRLAFLKWLHAEAARFALPLSIGMVEPTRTELRLEGVHPAIWVSLQENNEINVGVDWDGSGWDLLLWLDACEQPGPGGVGWIDYSLLPEFQIIHQTAEELWHVNVFEPFLRWINDDLAHATHLAMWRSPNDATWARLTRDGKILGTNWTIEADGEGPTHLLPLHSSTA